MTVPEALKFADHLSDRPHPGGIDVVCTLQHFAIITYAVELRRLASMIPRRFSPVTVTVGGKERALLSVVPFLNASFTPAVFPFPNLRMGQTNYRIYVIDSATGERGVWFLGTTLDSWTLIVPRFVWNLPWHGGRIAFQCDFDKSQGLYKSYQMRTQSKWAPASVSLTQRDAENFSFPGFPDAETALVYLTHPLIGFFQRHDEKIRAIRIWHQRFEVKPARLRSADFSLLSRTGLVKMEEQQSPYSVLIDPMNEITIYLPPKVLQ